MLDGPICFQYQKLERNEVIAIRAVNAGEASPDQQALAMRVIVKNLSNTHDLAYVPGSPHDSAFMAGRQFVGYQILKCVTQPVDKESSNVAAGSN